MGTIKDNNETVERGPFGDNNDLRSVESRNCLRREERVNGVGFSALSDGHPRILLIPPCLRETAKGIRCLRGVYNAPLSVDKGALKASTRLGVLVTVGRPPRPSR